MTAALAYNAPVSEFIDFLRDRLIAGGADARFINRIDDLYDECISKSELEDMQAEHDDEMDKLRNERDDIAEEFMTLYHAAEQETVTKDILDAAWACITRNKIT